ncbi:MAG: winged helix-turn-helix transcriptional regulator [Candidatus Hodarchaeales archaeon]|jgi:DNA-binding transcriptional regulator GbsR (MarR family)
MIPSPTPDEESLKQVITEFTTLFESWLNDTGAGPYAGRILMTILLSDTPLTQKDIAHKLGISVSTVSRNIKLITDRPPLIMKTKIPNTKEWQYEKRSNTPMVLLSGMILSFISMLRNNVSPMTNALKRMGNLSEEFLRRSETKRFQNTLENLLSATKIMLDELDTMLISFQAQTTEG